MRKIIGGLLAAGLLISTTACEVPEEGGGSSGGKAAGAPQVKVRAPKILKEFERNELKADAKYKGKVLQVTGKVDKVDTEFLDDKKYVLRLGGPGFNMITVNCADIPSKELSTIDKGQRVTMIGKFKDAGDLGVEMENCRLA